MNDPISDMLNRLTNAANARQEQVDIPHSKIKAAIAAILVGEGFVARSDVHKKMEKKYLRLTLKYRPNKKPVIGGLRRISTPGRRAYVEASKLPRVHAGFGTAIISTSRGLLTEAAARQQKIGGEVLCYIW